LPYVGLFSFSGKAWNPATPGGHSFATGGSNAAEHWFNASELGTSLLPNTPGYYKHLGSHTEESCTQYNALKVARHLFQWSSDPKIADYYERAFLNGILGNENIGSDQPTDTVDFEYMLPLGGGGETKPWGLAPGQNFPCCWGTLYVPRPPVLVFASPSPASGLTFEKPLLQAPLSSVSYFGVMLMLIASFLV
jgi:hypothetical protein